MKSGYGEPIVVTHDPDEVARAERIVLPVSAPLRITGAGSMRSAAWWRRSRRGCAGRAGRSGHLVGMQLMAERGREYEVTQVWADSGEVDRITPSDPDLKIPHMGWNTLNEVRPHKLLDDIPVGPQGLHAYFVHSYELKAAERASLVAEADYGGPVTAIVGRDTAVGTQFHPEKSQRLGLKLIANFLQWKP